MFEMLFWCDTEIFQFYRSLLILQLPGSMYQLWKSIENDGSDDNGQYDAIGSCNNLSEENGEDAEMTQIELLDLRASKLSMFEEIILCNIFCLYACVD